MTKIANPEEIIKQKEAKLEAQFWRSPFAVAAAIVLATQSALMALAMIQGQPVQPYVGLPFIFLGLMFLAVGILPKWNYLRVDDKGFEQHAGLTGIQKEWKKVQNIRVYQGWVEIRHVDGSKPGEKKVRTARLLNRYGLSAEAFGDLIELRWRKARGLEM